MTKLAASITVILTCITCTLGAVFIIIVLDGLMHKFHHRNEPEIELSSKEVFPWAITNRDTDHPVYLTTTNGKGWLDKQRIEK